MIQTEPYNDKHGLESAPDEAQQAIGEQHDGITCPTCLRNFPSYPDFTAHIGNPTCANETVQSSEPWCYHFNLTHEHLADRACCGHLVPPPDRQAASLGTLDAHGLAALRSILLDTLDSYPWQFYPDGDEWERETPETNAERLGFCDAVQAAIVKAAAPATAKGERR